MKLNVPLTYNPAIPLLNTYPRKIKTYIYLKTCTQFLMTALFLTAKSWKQSKGPSGGERITKQNTKQQEEINYGFVNNLGKSLRTRWVEKATPQEVPWECTPGFLMCKATYLWGQVQPAARATTQEPHKVSRVLARLHSSHRAASWIYTWNNSCNCTQKARHLFTILKSS